MKLNKLHAALALVLGSMTLQAQYVYLDFQDTTVSQNGHFVDIDLNNDTAYDFRFTLLRDTGTTTNLIDAAIVSPFDSVTSGIFGQQRGLFHYADRLEVGDLISATASSWQGMSPTDEYGTIDYRFDSVHDPYSHWQAPYTDGFLGARIEKDGAYIYGWIRLELAADGKSFTLKDCAYQQKADSTIEAGHLWISLDDRVLEGYRWARQHEAIYLQRPQNHPSTQVSVYAMTGQLLLQGAWTDAEWAIPASLTRDSMILVVVQSPEGTWIQRIPLR